MPRQALPKLDGGANGGGLTGRRSPRRASGSRGGPHFQSAPRDPVSEPSFVGRAIKGRLVQAIGIALRCPPEF